MGSWSSFPHKSSVADSSAVDYKSIMFSFLFLHHSTVSFSKPRWYRLVLKFEFHRCSHFESNELSLVSMIKNICGNICGLKEYSLKFTSMSHHINANYKIYLEISSRFSIPEDIIEDLKRLRLKLVYFLWDYQKYCYHFTKTYNIWKSISYLQFFLPVAVT